MKETIIIIPPPRFIQALMTAKKELTKNTNIFKGHTLILVRDYDYEKNYLDQNVIVTNCYIVQSIRLDFFPSFRLTEHIFVLQFATNSDNHTQSLAPQMLRALGNSPCTMWLSKESFLFYNADTAQVFRYTKNEQCLTTLNGKKKHAKNKYKIYERI